MKIKRKTVVLRRFEDIADSRLEIQIGNKTKLHRSKGNIELSCPVCGDIFYRKGCEVKPTVTNYCTVQCNAIAHRKQIAVNCRICGRDYTVKQSMVDVITCCGPECRLKALSESTSANDKKMWKAGIFKRGQESPAAKLTNDNIKSILNDKRVHRIIAQDYGVTRANISRIKRVAANRDRVGLKNSV
jgi:hypothetical protein